MPEETPMLTAAPVASATPGLTPAQLDEVLREYMEVTGRLQQTHETLQGEIVRLRQELANKDRELELRRRLSALGELAAGVAHEVRNPLGAIQLYSGLLRNTCRAHQLEPALQLIDKIEAGIQAIDGVVRDTLALAPRSRELQSCCVAEILAGARAVAQRALLQHDTTLAIDNPDASCCVRADREGLQRVLVNLIINAVDASPVQSIVEVAVTSGSDGRVRIAVCDRGCGLAAETRDRIFDPFFTTKEHGTGLGLTIAHRLIEAYGGELTAENRVGGGAEFGIVLPGAAPADHLEGLRATQDISAA